MGVRSIVQMYEVPWRAPDRQAFKASNPLPCNPIVEMTMIGERIWDNTIVQNTRLQIIPPLTPSASAMMFPSLVLRRFGDLSHLKRPPTSNAE
jgi:hypothetical protein